MKVPFKSRTAAAPAAETIARNAPDQAAPTGSGRYRGLLAWLMRERITLFGMIGADEEFAMAQAAAAERGCSIDVALRDRITELRGQSEAILTEQRTLRDKKLAQMREAGPLVTAALEERSHLEKTIRSLKADIDGFDRARDEFTEKLVDAGLSPAEILNIEPKPTRDDLAVWHNQLADARRRDADLAKMIAGGASAFLPETA